MIRAVLAATLLAACGSAAVPAGPDGGQAFDGGPDAGVPADGGLETDGGPAPDGGSAPDGGPGVDGGAGVDGGPVDGGAATWDPEAAPPSPASFPLGVQAGDVTSVAAVLWTRYAGTEALSLRVVEDSGSPGPAPLLHDLAVSPADGGFAHVDLGGLRPDTRYRFAFLEASGRRSPVGRFRTAPSPTAPAKVRFGATSCTHQNHRPFAPLSRAAEEKLDFFLLLGDTSYNDSAISRDQYRARWAENLSSTGYLDLFASTSHLATWDDHEVVNDWNGETVDPARLATARAVFFEMLAIRRQPPPNENRIWRSFRWGNAVEVFVLDCRSERRPSTRFTSAAEYVSRAQIDWLKAGLAASTAAFKVIANSVPIANFPGLFDLLANDRWEGYEAQRAEILDFIVGQGLKGVVWVSGDFHLGAVARIEPSGPRAAYYDILAGPGGQNGNPITATLGEPQFELATNTNNVVIFDADGTVDPPTLRLRFVDGSGQVFHEKTLTP
jgi:alkaline phosphatase D